jgi:RNA polymerase-associated protein CTR9
MQKGDYKGQVPLLLIFANMTLAKARKAPKVLVPEARYDKLPEDTKTKQYYLETAQQMLQQAQALQEKAGERLDIIGFLSRGASLPSCCAPACHDADAASRPPLIAAVLLLGQGQADQALKDLDSILKEQPANLVALMCMVSQGSRRARDVPSHH